MERRHVDTDVAVIGGGPAGAAAAITCARHGLRVRVFERDAFAGERVGEALHPGVEPVLAQLGVAERLASVAGARHAGIWVDWGGRRGFQPFGADEGGPWLGYQVSRAAFDAMLLARAGALGAEVAQPCDVTGVLIENGRVVGVQTDAGPVLARVVVDASGRTHWLGRKLSVTQHRRWPRLLARYGYVAGRCTARDEVPALVGNADGWQWTARVRPEVYQWVRVTPADARRVRVGPPEEFAGLRPLGSERGADVTWRIGGLVAGEGWFAVGDAAAQLDPTSGRGVLKALLTGIAAGELIAAALYDWLSEAEAARSYGGWLGEWFAEDASRLGEMHARLGLAGFDAPVPKWLRQAKAGDPQMAQILRNR